MGTDVDAARDVARTNFRATVVAALLGCVGVIAAAWIGTAVGRNQVRQDVKQQTTELDAAIADRDRRIAQLNAQVKSLQETYNQSEITQPATLTMTSDDEWRDPRSVEGFTFTLKACSRRVTTVNCQFSIVSDDRDTYLYLWGTSRLIGTDGTDRLASAISLAGKTARVGRHSSYNYDYIRGVPVSGGVVFEGVPASGSPDRAAVIELVASGFTVQFRNVPLS